MIDDRTRNRDTMNNNSFKFNQSSALGSQEANPTSCTLSCATLEFDAPAHEVFTLWMRTDRALAELFNAVPLTISGICGCCAATSNRGVR